jgi:hypothetical protein
MRLLPLITIAAAVPALAACGEGSAFDNSFRTSYRERAVEGCLSGIRAGAPAGVRLDFRRVCECAVDRHMEGKSATELMQADDATATQRAAEQCVMEEARRTGGGSAVAGDKPTG